MKIATLIFSLVISVSVDAAPSKARAVLRTQAPPSQSFKTAPDWTAWDCDASPGKSVVHDGVPPQLLDPSGAAKLPGSDTPGAKR